MKYKKNKYIKILIKLNMIIIKKNYYIKNYFKL